MYRDLSLERVLQTRWTNDAHKTHPGPSDNGHKTSMSVGFMSESKILPSTMSQIEILVSGGKQNKETAKKIGSSVLSY